LISRSANRYPIQDRGPAMKVRIWEKGTSSSLADLGMSLSHRSGLLEGEERSRQSTRSSSSELLTRKQEKREESKLRDSLELLSIGTEDRLGSIHAQDSCWERKGEIISGRLLTKESMDRSNSRMKMDTPFPIWISFISLPSLPITGVERGMVSTSLVATRTVDVTGA